MKLSEHFSRTIWSKYHTVKETDTEYCIRITDRVCEIDFQGSMSSMDWKQNMMFWKKQYLGAFIHKGFLTKFKSMRLILIKFFNANDLCFDNIIIRGFSQGAAIALILHYYLKRLGIRGVINKSVKTILFGCPRVFSCLTSRKYFKDVISIAVDKDLTTHLPPWLFFYRHMVKVKLIGRKPWWYIFRAKYHFPNVYSTALMYTNIEIDE